MTLASATTAGWRRNVENLLLAGAVGFELRSDLFREAQEHLAAYIELYLTAAMTGLRQGELIALPWLDVDWVARRIRVADNFPRGRVDERDSPKSHEGRSVPMARDRVHGRDQTLPTPDRVPAVDAADRTGLAGKGRRPTLAHA
jgi:integrase